MEREPFAQVPVAARPVRDGRRIQHELAAANNTITTGTILAPGGFIGSAEITEVGVKSSLIDERLFLTLARYQQTRTDISNPEDPTEGADITSSETTGIEFELKWVPSRDVFVSVFALMQESDYIFASNGNIAFDGRMLGFQDVVDPATGEVIYPAEAFIYGGKASGRHAGFAERSSICAATAIPRSNSASTRATRSREKFGFNGGITWFSEIPVTRVGLSDRARGHDVEPGHDLGRRRLAPAAERLEHDRRDAATGRATATAPRC